MSCSQCGQPGRSHEPRHCVLGDANTCFGSSSEAGTALGSVSVALCTSSQFLRVYTEGTRKEIENTRNDAWLQHQRHLMLRNTLFVKDPMLAYHVMTGGSFSDFGDTGRLTFSEDLCGSSFGEADANLAAAGIAYMLPIVTDNDAFARQLSSHPLRQNAFKDARVIPLRLKMPGGCFQVRTPHDIEFNLGESSTEIPRGFDPVYHSGVAMSLSSALGESPPNDLFFDATGTLRCVKCFAGQASGCDLDATDPSDDDATGPAGAPSPVDSSESLLASSSQTGISSSSGAPVAWVAAVAVMLALLARRNSRVSRGVTAGCVAASSPSPPAAVVPVALAGGIDADATTTGDGQQLPLAVAAASASASATGSVVIEGQSSS